MNPVKVRIIYFSTWADGLQDAAAYLASLPSRNLAPRVSRPGDPELLRMARLDCDWDGECLRSFATLTHEGLTFEPALVADARGLLEFTAQDISTEVRPWLVLINQRPASVAPVIGKLLGLFRRSGGHVLYYSYDDASRAMACHAADVAPHLSVLIHDEHPLAPDVARALPVDCRTIHTSWTANIIPFTHPFEEQTEKRIVFLGSKLGVTEHRLKQIRTLERHFKDRFTAFTDHSVPVPERGRFGRIQVHLCPEGRKFTTPSMSRTHTDRPFWAGCMGQVPVSENSRSGDRLTDLVENGVLLSYDHGDQRSMIARCEQALELDCSRRLDIYEYFNRHGTVGPLVAAQIAAFHGVADPRTLSPVPA